jgi:hypothetical protein
VLLRQKKTAVPCGVCHGDKAVLCDICGGEKAIRYHPFKTMPHQHMPLTACAMCSGTGQQTCLNCLGEGYVSPGIAASSGSGRHHPHHAQQQQHQQQQQQQHQHQPHEHLAPHSVLAGGDSQQQARSARLSSRHAALLHGDPPGQSSSVSGGVASGAVVLPDGSSLR